jgi:hypothetical protein
MLGCLQTCQIWMKKRVAKWKILAWITALISGTLVLLWSWMPRLFESSFQSILHQLGGELNVITIEQINPWALQLTDLSVETQEGNLSLKQLDARYNPLDLAKGKAHSLSLTSPVVRIDPGSLLERLRSDKSEDDEKKSVQSVAKEFLLDPPLQHVRLRDVSISLANEEQALLSNLALEGDFYKGLAQVRLDGNLSGLAWFGDLTMVEEGQDLFLGASLSFPNLTTISQSLAEVSSSLEESVVIDLRKWFEVDQGSARGHWSARIQDDGIMDQFMDFNVSELVLQCLGFSIQVPQAILFVTPRSPTWIESNFYANANWGENLDIQGLKVSANLQEGKPALRLRIQRMRTEGILPKVEIIGLVIDEVEFAFDDEGEFIGIEQAVVRFSALHLDEGLFNLYDGELSLKWLGEDRFHLELRKANGSLPTFGVNLHHLMYAGEISLDSFPKIATEQTVAIEEAFVGEDQKIEDLKVGFKLDSLERIELSKVSMRVNDFDFSFDPANLAIEMPESEEGGVDFSVLDGEIQFQQYDDFSVRDINGHVKLNSLDPLESNGTQSIRFDLHAAEQVLKDGEIRFDLLSSGEKIIEFLELHALGGVVVLEETKISETLDDLKLVFEARGLRSQEIISLFDDLDARMDGNLSGVLNLLNTPHSGWDFNGGALSLDASETARLFLNTNGILTEGLEVGSSEFKNMYLLEKALQNLKLDAFNVIFKVMDNGERVVEMNVRGESEVEGKDISVEYRPKIIGGLDALIQQADLSKWGINP